MYDHSSDHYDDKPPGNSLVRRKSPIEPRPIRHIYFTATTTTTLALLLLLLALFLPLKPFSIS